MEWDVILDPNGVDVTVPVAICSVLAMVDVVCVVILYWVLFGSKSILWKKNR